ncbi:bactofilin family protein [Insolitispirillum peregrinum]
MSSAISLSPTASVPSSLRRGSYLAPDLVVRGRIQCSGVVEIDGAMQGDIQAETLVVGPQGRISAAIDANTALVGGKVDGVLKSRAVTFAQGCDFNGEVQYEALGVEPEASVQGVLVPVVGSNARHHAGQTILPVERPVSRMPKVTAKPAARAASAEGQAGASRERASPRGRTILWVVTLMGVLLGAGLAALVGGTPGVVQWWTLVRSEPPVTAPAKPPASEEPAVTAGAEPSVPSAAASGEPPVDAQPAKVAPVVDKPVVAEKQISAKAQADAEIAEKATTAARIKADAEAKAKADAL